MAEQNLWDQFQEELKKYIQIPSPSLFVAGRKAAREQTGKKFYSSLKELKKILPTKDYYLLESMLRQAIAALKQMNAFNYLQLQRAMQRLRKYLENNKHTNKYKVKDDLVKNVFYTGAGFFTGTMGIGLAANLSVTIATATSIAALGAGPWFFLALSAALAVLGAVIIAIEIAQAYQNARFLADKQLSEMEVFIKSMEPQADLKIAPKKEQPLPLSDFRLSGVLTNSGYE